MAAEPSDAEIQSAMAVILKEGVLSQLTSRIVRNKLQEKFGVDFYGRKKEIDKMLMKMIEDQEKSAEDENQQENGTSDDKNGVEQEESDQEDEDSDSEDDDEPSPKKIKQDTEKDTHDTNDAELARKLHENENGRTRRQAARKPVERKKPAKTKQPKESSGNKKTGFAKLMVLSPALAEVMGEEKMSRSDVVKKMWEIIRERKLEDPKNKRFTLCDEQLQHIFGRKKIMTFGMMKYLKKHMWDPALIA